MGIIFGIIFITASLCFKFGAAPFHIWVPDIYQGSLISTTILLSTIPKISVFIVFLKLYYIPFMEFKFVWSDILIFVGVIHNYWKYFCSYSKNIKRLLAYSAISNIGFIFCRWDCSNDGLHASLLLYNYLYFYRAGNFRNSYTYNIE